MTKVIITSPASTKLITNLFNRYFLLPVIVRFYGSPQIYVNWKLRSICGIFGRYQIDPNITFSKVPENLLTISPTLYLFGTRTFSSRTACDVGRRIAGHCFSTTLHSTGYLVFIHSASWLSMIQDAFLAQTMLFIRTGIFLLTISKFYGKKISRQRFEFQISLGLLLSNCALPVS